MRKRIVMMTCLYLFVLLILYGCIFEPEGYKFDYNDLKDNVISIELIYYDNFDAQIIERKNVEKSFDFTKMNIIKELDEKHLDEFILDMSNIDITMFDHMSETPIGESIKMNYRNGDSVVMSEISKGEKTWRFVGRFAKNGELINAIGGFWWSSYADLVNKYFNNKIE